MLCGRFSPQLYRKTVCKECFKSVADHANVPAKPAAIPTIGQEHVTLGSPGRASPARSAQTSFTLSPKVAVSEEGCQACSGHVYLAERVEINGMKFHKRCFKCKTCKLTLNTANSVAVGDLVYCRNHARAAEADPAHRRASRSVGASPNQVISPTAVIALRSKPATSSPLVAQATKPVCKTFKPHAYRANKCRDCMHDKEEHSAAQAPAGRAITMPETSSTVAKRASLTSVVESSAEIVATTSTTSITGSTTPSRSVFTSSKIGGAFSAVAGQPKPQFNTNTTTTTAATTTATFPPSISSSSSLVGGQDQAGSMTSSGVSSAASAGAMDGKTNNVLRQQQPARRAPTLPVTSAAGGGETAHAPGSNHCFVCSKVAYMMDRLETDGKVFHKWCFRCAECQKTLNAGNYAGLHGRVYCKPHFKSLFKLKGNYDEGFGHVQHKHNWSRGADDKLDAEADPTSPPPSAPAMLHKGANTPGNSFSPKGSAASVATPSNTLAPALRSARKSISAAVLPITPLNTPSHMVSGAIFTGGHTGGIPQSLARRQSQPFSITRSQPRRSRGSSSGSNSSSPTAVACGTFKPDSGRRSMCAGCGQSQMHHMKSTSGTIAATPCGANEVARTPLARRNTMDPLSTVRRKSSPSLDIAPPSTQRKPSQPRLDRAGSRVGCSDA